MVQMDITRLDAAYLIVTVLVVTVSFTFAFMPSSASRFDPAGKFCYVTGGSTGLGRAVAEELVKRGANVVIVARSKGNLDDAVTHLKVLAKPGQTIMSIAADLSTHKSSSAALSEAAAAFGGRAPDHVFLCAGFSKPQFFIDAPPEDLQWAMDGTYWVQAWTAHAVARMMVAQKQPGKIVFVSSFLGLTTFAGYATYSPAKYAIRGLADALRSEMLLHDIGIHLYLPAGMLSPGYEVEQRTKPAITKKIEDGDTPIPPAQAAAILLRGMERGHYQITNDLVTNLVRVQTAGAVPGNGPLDLVYGAISAVGLPIWRMITDSQVRGAKAAVAADRAAR